MNIRVELETPERAGEIPAVLDFLVDAGLAGPGDGIWWGGTKPKQHSPFKLLKEPPEGIHLDVVLAPVHRKPPVRDTRHARLFVGSAPPRAIDYFCLPVEGKRFQAPWMRRLLTEAQRLNHKVRLMYCEHGLVANEIMRFADWFRLDSVKEAMRGWIDEEMQAAFQDLIESFPNTEVHCGVGKLSKLLQQEDRERVILLGSLDGRYHPTGRYHGINYANLLSQTGLSGYFLAD
ncbi:MAG: hypothetical protein QNK37_27380 [Acidobacteriota bacterium]|nr:hypothetical protein [Acidobacteriota bacterium]